MPAAWQAAVAATPLAAILVAMLALRWSAARAGLLGLALATAVAWLGFGYGSRTFAHLGPAIAIGGALLEAAFLTATILWIVFPALCIHELQLRTGAVGFGTSAALAAPFLVVAGFAVGAAVGNIVSPHNVIAAGATVALSGREGEVLRRTFGVALVYALAGGLLALFAFT